MTLDFELGSEPLELLDALRSLIQQGRQQALRAVDMVQVQTCWEVGRHIWNAVRTELSWTHYRFMSRLACTVDF